ncbi:MAG: PD-(D/E)XK nuclease family protein [Halarcobacter sp.]
MKQNKYQDLQISLFDLKLDDKVYDNEYKEILYTNKSLKHFDKEIELDIDLSTITWSASALKEFLECKRKYYLNHILKIKEHDISIMPKAYELGNIVHKTLENYYKQDNRTYEKIVEIFNENRVDCSFLNFELEIWKKRLKSFFELEKERFKEKLSVLDLEKNFLTKFEGIKIKGTIDRIDKLDNTYVVVDYKTSKNLTISTKRTYEKSVDFQLEFYYIALENLYSTTNIEAYYYDLYNMKLIKESLLDEKLLILKDIFKQLHTQKVNFNKCDKLQTCQYCNYKTICNR